MNHHGFIFDKPEVEWKSEWRKGFEHYLANRKSEPKRAKYAETEGNSIPNNKRIRVRVSTYVERNCLKCPNEIGPQNKIGLCRQCATKSVRTALKIGPKPKCTICGSELNRNNKSGLCDVHGKVARQLAYMARKKALRMNHGHQLAA